ncbi:MAG: ABC transporter permease subunit [Verrucomicrobiota bacterium]
MKGSLSRIFLLAGTTFLEAVRQKFFSTLLLISIALVISSNFFQQFDFGTGELKFIADFGFGALFFFGSILAIAAMTQLFFNEIENRTALTILAKPVHRLEFLSGKFLGAYLLMLVFTVVITVVLAGILYWRETSLMARIVDEAFAHSRLIRYPDLALFGFLQWIKFGVILSFTLLIASFSNTNLYTLVVSFFVLIICQLQYIARDAYLDMENGPLRLMTQAMSLIFPNFQLFNVGDQLVFDNADLLPATTAVQIAVYGMIYMITFVLLSQIHFKRREI